MAKKETELLKPLAKEALQLGAHEFVPLRFLQQRQLEEALQEAFGDEVFLFTMPLRFAARLQEQSLGYSDEASLQARAYSLLRQKADALLPLLGELTGAPLETLQNLRVSELYQLIQYLLEVHPLAN